MGHIELDLSDTTGFELGTESAPAPYRENYEVVNPIFKRGQEWEPGDHIDLDPATAARFIETGDIKEIA